MAIVFPASPSVNDTFTAGSITYKWDGDKWIGLGVTPADRLVEGSNSLEIDANNNLVWSGGNLLVGKPAGNFVLDVEKSDENTLRLSNSAETTHGSHDTKLVSGRSFYSNFLLQASSYKFQTWNGSAIANRLVVDANGNVGINKTPETDWSVSYRALEIGNSSVSAYQGGTFPSIELNMNCRGTASSYGAGWKYISAGERASQIQLPYSGEIEFKHAAVGANAGDDITWVRSARFTNTGDLEFPSGQGISFSPSGIEASGTITNTSQLLDDYEEGLWSPRLVGSTSGEASGYNHRKAGYLKVGNLVHVYGYMALSNVGNIVGNVRIADFPFATKNDTAYYHAPAFGWYTGMTGTTAYGLGLDMAAGNTLHTIVRGNGTGVSSLTVGEISNNFAVEWAFTYRTS